ncbi:MAG: bifunctional phosphopantothenoylcysteine decarboxylase/phosphopantothenate--cysteine ligase CoaBC [Pseudomonadota bacterium]
MYQPVLSFKKILLGVTGGIAAYKAAELVRELCRQQAAVKVVMTENATRFVGPVTFQALSRNPVYVDLFSAETSTAPHIDLAREPDVIIVAPATADFIGKIANGIADDLLTTIILAARKPILVCPAMNSDMYDSPALRANLERIRGYGCQVVEPGIGPLACGDDGPGRLAEISVICESAGTVLEAKDLRGEHVLITAGPTQEPIDPVRFISNRSSGKMGFNLARVARRRGAKVTLVSGPTDLPRPWDVEFHSVSTASEMYDAVRSCFEHATIVIKTAAVGDYKLESPLKQKIKKKGAGLNLELIPNIDILKELGRIKKTQLLVGFAAETRYDEKEARRKLADKNLDMIVVNEIANPGVGFGCDTNQVKIIVAGGGIIDSPLAGKEEISYLILDKIIEFKNK